MLTTDCKPIARRCRQVEMKVSCSTSIGLLSSNLGTISASGSLSAHEILLHHRCGGHYASTDMLFTVLTIQKPSDNWHKRSASSTARLNLQSYQDKVVVCIKDNVPFWRTFWRIYVNNYIVIIKYTEASNTSGPLRDGKKKGKQFWVELRLCFIRNRRWVANNWILICTDEAHGDWSVCLFIWSFEEHKHSRRRELTC